MNYANWQKYFAENNLKQPFAQIWEPVIDFAKVKENRYLGCGIPLYRFNNQEKHGIHLYTAKEYVYYKNRTEYTSIDILLSGCPIEWHMMEGDICDATMQSPINIKSFTFNGRTRRTNHIIGYLDRCTVYGRIAIDNDSVLEMLDGYTVAQINSFIKFSIEKGSTKCTAGLLDYKKKHFSDFPEIDEFTLDF